MSSSFRRWSNMSCSASSHIRALSAVSFRKLNILCSDDFAFILSYDKKKWHDSTFYFLLRHHTFTELQRFSCPAFFIWFFETKLFTVKMAIRLKWGLPRWKFRANFSTVRLFVEYFDASWISYKLFHAFFVLADTWACFFRALKLRRELIFSANLCSRFFPEAASGDGNFIIFSFESTLAVYTLCCGRLEKSVDWIDQKGASTFHPKSDIWCFACSFWQTFHDYLCTFVGYKKEWIFPAG